VDDDRRDPADYPKVFEVDWVRVSRRREATGRLSFEHG
jgi:hypothetical protein